MLHVFTYRVWASEAAFLVNHEPIRYRGREYRVLDRFIVGRKTYLAVANLSRGDRQRYQVFDPHAGPGGAMRCLHILPISNESRHRAKLLNRLGKEDTELPQILEYHTFDSSIGIVLPWFEGSDLRKRLRDIRVGKRRPMGTPETIRLFRGLAHALSHLHRHRNMIHADVKPANLIISNDTRRLTLIDYGSAWAVEGTSRRSEGDGKSSQYSAPELLRGESFVNFRADYFSLCAVCYELLTLEVPYDGLGGNAGLPQYRLQSESTLIPPSQLSPEASRLAQSHWRRIDNLICRGLALDADDRFPQKREWLDAWDETNGHLRRKDEPGVFQRWLFGAIDWLDGRKSRT